MVNALQISFDTFKAIFEDPKFAIANFLSLASYSTAPLQSKNATGSIQKRSNEDLKVIENTVKILALANIYELGESVKFQIQDEGRALLNAVNDIFYSLDTDDIEIQNNLINLHSTFINEITNKTNTLPALQLKNIQVSDNIFNILYQYNESLDYLDYVILINRIKDINNIKGNILIPVKQ